MFQNEHVNIWLGAENMSAWILCNRFWCLSLRRLHKFLHFGLWVTDAPVLATAIAHGALVSISCKNIYMVIFYTFSTIETKKKYFIFYGGP